VRTVWLVAVVGVVFALGIGTAQAAGLDLPVEGGSAVWIQPLDGSAGSMGAAISLRLPQKVVGATVADLLKLEVVIHPQTGQVRIDPGLSLTLTTDVGIPVKVGILALPLTDYKVGWMVGAQVFATF